jgi:hypothetical protein
MHGRAIEFVTKQIRDFLTWYITVSDAHGIEHNDMHTANVVYDRSTKRLRMIDLGRMLMNADFGDDEVLESVCEFTGRSFTYELLYEHLSDRLNSVAMPHPLAPWLGDVARFTVESFLEATDTAFPGSINFGWGMDIRKASVHHLVFSEHLRSAEGVRDAVREALDTNTLAEASHEPIADLMAIASIGFATISIFMIRAQTDFAHVLESDLPTPVRAARMGSYRKISLRNLTPRLIWERYHDLLTESDVEICIEIKDMVMQHLATRDPGPLYSMMEGGRGRDVDVDVDEMCAREDTLMSMIFPTTLERAYARHDEKRAPVLGESERDVPNKVPMNADESHVLPTRFAPQAHRPMVSAYGGSRRKLMRSKKDIKRYSGNASESAAVMVIAAATVACVASSFLGCMHAAFDASSAML